MAVILHLVIPGLLDCGLGSRHRADPAFPRPTAPALEWLLAHAQIENTPTPAEATLFELFGVPILTEGELPIAAVTRLADGAQADGGWWWRADPVHFHSDLHGVILMDARALAIEATEARALVAAFNQTFQADGLQLEALRPDRWYLRLAAAPEVRTQPLAAATGRDIRNLLPDGPAKGRWHRLLTEAQMLFHSHPVNQRREERNQLLINGLWLWGGGIGPTAARPPAAGLYANDPLTRGLARLADSAISPIPENASDWLEAATDEPDSLVVLDMMRHDATDGDIALWAEHIVILEQRWFGWCRRWLNSGQLTALHLYCGNGWKYRITHAARWRFWRYPKPLSTYLS